MQPFSAFLPRSLAKERITRVLRQPETLPQLVAPDALRQLAAAVLQARAAGAGSRREGGGGSCAAGSAARAAADGVAAATAAGLRPDGPSEELQQQLLTRLQRDVEACVMCDRIYSPASGEQGSDCSSWGIPLLVQRAHRLLRPSRAGAGFCTFTDLAIVNRNLPASYTCRPCRPS